ncbi:hypothetical protein O6H91_09G029900 [Diphasiastrum complanatum]|uniref:Uncharacterized protein n=3 Tax=Diphasiastrum complanatum TaxID=34168 RepID=A0ACC2CMQ8_DIPCM|nr:hypothetical protein O6H91_09G029900 [Diphasiastrum complanatum]
MGSMSLQAESSTSGLTNRTDFSPLDDVEQGIPGLLTIQSDGSVVRSNIFLQNVDACQIPVDGVASKDVVVDSDRGLIARIFVPMGKKQEEERSIHKKLPVTLFVHGGGFCMFSASTVIFHDFCRKMAQKANTLVVSIDYRLAPEHRLPTAYNDCFDFLKWLQSQASEEDRSTVDPWLDCYADFSRCFWFGESAGANIVHHIALRATTEDLRPLQVKGLVLSQPFFGSEERTASEIELEHDEPIIPPALCDEFWKFSLPHGASRDHPYSNPLNEVLPPLSKLDLPRMLVVVGGLDPLRDHQFAYVSHVHEAGKNVKLLFFRDAQHSFPLMADQSMYADMLLKCLVKFMQRRSKPTETSGCRRRISACMNAC